MIRFKSWPLFFLILACATTGCGPKETKVVARIGNHMISLADFEDSFLRKKPIGMAILNKMDLKQEYLDELVTRQMKLQLAEQLKLRQYPDMVSELLEIETRAAYIAALENRVMYNIIKEKEIRSYYDKSGMDVRVRHILFATRGDTSRAKIESLTQKANDVIAALRGGGDFSDLVKQYSDDEYSSRKGGDLGYLKWGAMDSVFMEAALQSKRYQVFPRPVRTEKGLHVIQVTDKKKTPRKPLAMVRSDIVQRLFNKYRSKVLTNFKQFSEGLITEFNVVPEEENIKIAADFLHLENSDSLFDAHIQAGAFDASWIPQKTRELILVTYDGGTYALEELLVYMAKQRDRPPVSQIDAKTIQRMALDEIKYKITARIGFENGYLDKYDYRTQLNEQIEALLLEKLQADVIEKQTTFSDEAMQKYYKDNLNRYEVPPKAEIQEILVRDAETAQQVYEQAIAGANLNLLADKHNIRPETKFEFGRLGHITKDSYGVIGRTALAAEANTIHGPLETEDGFSVFKVLRKTPGRVRSFEESRRAIVYDLNTELIRESKKKWDTRMRSQFTVRIYGDVLEQAFQELAQS